MPAFWARASRPKYASSTHTIIPHADCSADHLQRAWGAKLCDKIRIREQGTELYNRHDTLSDIDIMCTTVLFIHDMKESS